MNKKDILELKRRFKKDACTFTRLCGCYVDADRNKVTTFGETFLNLEDEEFYKYLEIAKKVMSGTIGNNILELEFPTAEEAPGGRQQFLMGLRESALKNDDLMDTFYDLVIENYSYVGNYLILVFHDAYDVMTKTSDNNKLDESEEVYEYLLCAICPVTLTKPGLGYREDENRIGPRIRDWVVQMPQLGFLFPAFNDRSTDLHSTLYYSKDSDDLHDAFIEQMLGCPLPLPAGYQKESFQTIIEETLGDACDYETVKTIHENLSELIEEHKDEPEPLVLDKYQVRNLLENSGIEEEQLAAFDQSFDETAGEKASIYASNIANTRAFEVKTPDVIIKVNPDRTDLIETREIDGRQCLVIAIDGGVEVNGIAVTSGTAAKTKED